MMGWSPTSNRNAIGGLVHLFSRREWRESARGADLAGIARAAMDDDDEVNRLHAASVARWLEPDGERLLALIRVRLLEEPDNIVAAALITQLGFLVSKLTVEVDATLGELVATDRWKARLAVDASTPRTALDSLIDLVLCLTIVHEAPAARAITTGWMANPTDGPSRLAFSLLRPWLALPADRTTERRRAFELAGAAAHALAELRASEESDDIAPIYQSAETLVNEIFFASGAFGRDGNDHESVAAEPGFAEEAFAVIELLTEFKLPSIVHHLVRTLGHLAPSDPARAFLLVERAVRAGDAYTYDSLAADLTITLVERYLAEFRDVVTTDAEVLSAVRKVLDAFVRVGWPAAVSLSYRLGDAFR
jgi:hypothetical protein